MRSERILVTGGAGFIGSHLVHALIRAGHNVRILDNLSAGTRKYIEPYLNKGNATLVVGDIRNLHDVEVALKEVDEVFHLAAITSVPYSVENPAITYEVNSEGTRNILRASVNTSVKSLVYVSSCAVYGEPQYLPIDEEHPTNPCSPYAESKIRAEEYCRESEKKHGLKTVILRLFNVYGLGQSNNQYNGVIAKFIRSVRENNPPTIYGDGQQERDFVHVSDVMRALMLSSDNDRAVGQTFNIGTGKSVKISELCQLILRKLKSRVEPIFDKARSGDIKRSYADIRKAEEILGYRPRVTLAKGIGELVKQPM